MRMRMRLDWEFLDEATLERLYHDALEVWRRTPFRIDGTDEFFDYLSDFGCTVDGELVRFPDAVIDKTLARIAQVKARRKSEPTWPDSAISLFTHGQALHICDTETNALREATTADLESWCRLVDALGIEVREHPTFIPADAPTAARDFHAFATIILNSRRAHRVSVYSVKMLPLFAQAQAVADGGMDAVRANPIFATKCWVNSPFMITRENVDIAMEARRLLDRPIKFGMMPVAGASSPITVAGSLVQNTAESLALNAMSLAIDNVTCDITGSSSIMDMSQSTQRQSGPDQLLHRAASAQMHTHLFGGRPQLGFAYTGVSAQTVSAQSAEEKGRAIALSIAMGSRRIGCGSLAFSDVGSPVQLVLDRELAAFFEGLFVDVSFDPEHVGLESILATIPQGSRYMASEETAMFCREEGWFAKYLDHRPPLAWMEDPTDMVERARRDTLRLEKQAENQCPLSDAQQREIRDLVDQAHAIAQSDA